MYRFRGSLVVSLILTVCFFSIVHAEGSLSSNDSKPDYHKSVLHIRTWKQAIDVESPWQREKITEDSRLATLVDEKHLLTTASAVEYGRNIEVFQLGESKSFEAVPVCVDKEADLALLEVNPKDLLGYQPLAVGLSMKKNQEVDIVTFLDRNSFQIEKADFLKAGITQFNRSSYEILAYFFDVNTKGVLSSSPVIVNNELVGIVSRVSQEALTIPGPILSHFLTDCLSSLKFEKGKGATLPKNYRGFPADGLWIDKLTSPTLKKWLLLKETDQGVRIVRLEEDSPLFGKVFENDVLTKMNGISIDDYGNYEHKDFGKIPIQALLNQLYPLDLTEFTVLRGGKEVCVKVPLGRYDSQKSVIPYDREEKTEPYLIFGGLVFQEFSVSLFKNIASSSMDMIAHWIYLLGEKNEMTLTPKRFIVVNRVLADPYNRGYQDISKALVTEINGKKIQSLQDVSVALSQPIAGAKGGMFTRIKLGLTEREVILDYRSLSAAHTRIQKVYNLPADTSFFVPKQPN